MVGAMWLAIVACMVTAAAATLGDPKTCTASGAPADSSSFGMARTTGTDTGCGTIGPNSMFGCEEKGFRQNKISTSSGDMACYKYHCAKACGTCSGVAAGTVLTEPCSCKAVWAAKVAALASNCFPNPKVPRGGPCAYSYQCSTGFCCPQLKICLTDSADGTAYDLAPDWVKTIVNGGTCTSALSKPDQCACHDGKVSDGLPVKGYNQRQCSCKAAYLAHYDAGTWVTCGTPATCEDASTAATTTKAPSNCVATTTDGAACVFPFTVSLVEYNECTDVQNSGTYWCAKTVDSNGQYDGYGNCATNAPCASRSTPVQQPANADVTTAQQPANALKPAITTTNQALKPAINNSLALASFATRGTSNHSPLAMGAALLMSFIAVHL